MMPDNVLSTVPVLGQYLYPDGLLRDLKSDIEMGGIAINDPSQGLKVQVWAAFCDEFHIYIAPLNDIGNIQFTLEVSDVTELSLSFDSNMQPAIAYVTDNVVKLYWYDSTIPGFTTTEFVGAISPMLCMDDKRPESNLTRDVLFFYLKEGVLYYREQRDRYTVEYTLATVAFESISKLGMTTRNRVQIELRHTPAAATSTIPTPGGGKILAVRFTSGVNNQYLTGCSGDSCDIGLIDLAGHPLSGNEPLKFVTAAGNPSGWPVGMTFNDNYLYDSGYVLVGESAGNTDWDLSTLNFTCGVQFSIPNLANLPLRSTLIRFNFGFEIQLVKEEELSTEFYIDVLLRFAGQNFVPPFSGVPGSFTGANPVDIPALSGTGQSSIVLERSGNQFYLGINGTLYPITVDSRALAFIKDPGSGSFNQIRIGGALGGTPSTTAIIYEVYVNKGIAEFPTSPYTPAFTSFPYP